MIRKNRYFVSLLFFVFSVVVLKAQKTVQDNGLYFLRYQNQLMINDKWNVQSEIEMRRFFEQNRLNNVIAHSRLYYNTGATTNVAFGFAYSSQGPQNPASTSNLTVPEYRIQQEFNYSLRLSKRFGIQQRLRIDERFIRRNNGVELLDGVNFNWRFRFRLQATYLVSKEGASKRTILKASNEVMVNAGKNVAYNQFDQNRIYIGVERDLSDKFSAEIGYIKWYQQTAAGNVFFDRDILRITLYHKIKL